MVRRCGNIAPLALEFFSGWDYFIKYWWDCTKKGRWSILECVTITVPTCSKFSTIWRWASFARSWLRNTTTCPTSTSGSTKSRRRASSSTGTEKKCKAVFEAYQLYFNVNYNSANQRIGTVGSNLQIRNFV